MLTAHGEIQRVGIAVHVQPSGHPEADVQLTEARAETVRQFLVAHGVPASELEPHGYGGSKPLESPRKKGAAAVNERVEFVIVDRLAK
jgi:OOP family OmpA-OmpF porin